MKRIYQGRVVGAELLQAKGKGKGHNERSEPIDSWEDVLWQHYSLFQDAINYYIVALLAMATSKENPLYKIRCHLEGDGDFQVWNDFRKRGVLRPGMCHSLGKYFKHREETLTLKECFRMIVSGNNEVHEVIDLALQELLQTCSGDGAIQKEGRSMFPRFCDPEYGGQYYLQKIDKDKAQKRLATYLHDGNNASDLQKVKAHLKFEWFANIAKGSAPKKGNTAKQVLKDALRYLVEKHSIAEKSKGRLEKLIEDLPDSVTIQSYTGGSVNKDILEKKFYTYLLFTHVEQSEELFNVLRNTYRPPKEARKKTVKKTEELDLSKFDDDPVKLARGERGYIFPAFTCFLEKNEVDNNARKAWKEFDIAAFKEALKTIHQIDLKEKERAGERAGIQRNLDYMRGKTGEWKEEDSEDEAPPRMAGDPRIERLEAILKTDLAAEYEMVEGESVSYGLQKRTIRGFREIKKRWQKIVKAGEPFSGEKRELLLSILKDYQTENPEGIGSVLLFEKLTERNNWLIWQEPPEATRQAWQEQQFAEDPLDAMVRRSEYQERIEKLSQPVRLTPADPDYSGRQYLFSDWKAGCKHEPGVSAVKVACAMVDADTCRWQYRMIRLAYSAPRMVRDGMKSVDETDAGGAVWMQPMVEALLPSRQIPMDFTKTAVGLMPVVGLSGKKKTLLNFPVEIEDRIVAEQLKKQRFTEADFIKFKDSKRYIRWFTDKVKDTPAWTNNDTFTCLAADLGQRDAAAFAIVEASTKKNHGARYIGDYEGDFWYARLRQTGLLRLPGEDARVWRNNRLRTELSGERGRSATETEQLDAFAICRELEQDPRLFGEDISRLSYPELNDKLLVIMRRAQSRLARLHTWAWMIESGKNKQKKNAFEGIIKEDSFSESFRKFAEQNDAVKVKTKLIQEIKLIRPLLVKNLQEIANRILPRRDAVWVWRERNETGSGCVLALERRKDRDGTVLIRGQRGLSLERIEQVEELRRRCQSLNRTLLHEPGTKPLMGRAARGIELPDPCPEILGKMEALREQRVNQTAHLIVAEALGVRLCNHNKTKQQRQLRDIHGEYERIPGREPVDLVVLEDLSRYLSSQDRPRRENSRLMKWCHRAILAKVKELCEPYGIAVLETPAAWSSRFSSRDGKPGFRAVELVPGHKYKFPWNRDLQKYADVTDGKKKVDATERTRLQKVHHFFEILEKVNADKKKKGTKQRSLLAPLAGGPLFIPFQGPAMQADINAALNLALRAIAAPWVHDIHPRIRTERAPDTGLRVRRDNILEKRRWKEAYPVRLAQDSESIRLAADRNPNFFVDLDKCSLYGRAEINGIMVASGSGLWGTMNQKAWEIVNRLNADRLKNWGFDRMLEEKADEEEIPF